MATRSNFGSTLATLPNSAEPIVFEIDIRSEEEMEEELSRPTIPPLVSLTEAGSIGW